MPNWFFFSLSSDIFFYPLVPKKKKIKTTLQQKLFKVTYFMPPSAPFIRQVYLIKTWTYTGKQIGFKLNVGILSQFQKRKRKEIHSKEYPLINVFHDSVIGHAYQSKFRYILSTSRLLLCVDFVLSVCFILYCVSFSYYFFFFLIFNFLEFLI